MDDIVIYSNTIDEHDKLLYNVLKRLKENKLKINIDKIQLRHNEVILLGVKINGEEIKPTDKKRNEIGIFLKIGTLGNQEVF